jgi:hypothetical protein
LLLVEEFNDSELENIFGKLNQWDIDLSLEAGVLMFDLGFNTGQQAYDQGVVYWDKFDQCGAQIAEFTMNEPYWNFKFHGPAIQRDYAVAQTAIWISLVRARYPGVTIGSIEPYPALTVKEIIWWIDNLQAKCQEMEIQGIDFFCMDPDWAWQGSFEWEEVALIEAYCDSIGLPFSLICWAADCGSWPGTQYSDYDWYEGIMSQGSAAQGMGVTPDIFAVQSWLYIPRQIIPEDEQYSFTYSFLEFYQTYVQ